MARPTALIADDEPLLREALAGQLAAAWPELEVVAEARNGREAIELFDARHPEFHSPGRVGSAGNASAHDSAASHRSSERVPRGQHTGLAADASDQLVEERLGRWRGIPIAELEVHGDHVLGPEPGIDRGRAPERLGHEAGAGQEHQRDRELGDHQAATRA